VVILCGCDKTTPAALMGAASADLPAILVSGGPMLNGHWRGQTLGACTDCRRLTAEFRAGTLSEEEVGEVEATLVRSRGHCMVMGHASTMNSLTEALGISLPGNGAIPAADSRRILLAERAGRRIVAMAAEGLRPSRVLTRKAMENAITLLCALGGSTNAVVHLPALAGRLGFDLPLDLFDSISRRTPLLANVRPAGSFQMEDFFYAGGVPAIMRQLLPLLHGDEPTVTGRTVSENVAQSNIVDSEVIASPDKPLKSEGGLAILRGNLAPEGAVIKHAAASPGLLQHRGRAIVFHGISDLQERIDDPALDVNPEDVMILQNAGPVGGPGMPEVGNLPIPKKLLKQGVRDMVRISDARMSGTAFGTIVLHVAPEAAVGGPLSLARTGDVVELDVPGRRLELRVEQEELNRRRAEWQRPQPAYRRGYGRLFLDHVLQAPEGMDFDFLLGRDPVETMAQPKF